MRVTDVRVSEEGVVRFSTSIRTDSRSTPNDSNTATATPPPSRISPKSKCSVPMKLWFSRLASSLAKGLMTFLALSVNRSNMKFSLNKLSLDISSDARG